MRKTLLFTSLLCSFSFIHCCMEITKKENIFSWRQTKSGQMMKLIGKGADVDAVTQFFNEHKPNINTQSPRGYTFLMEAVRKQNIPVMKYLLEHKANPNLATHDHIYPIHLAIEFDDYYCLKEKPPVIILEIVSLLLQHGANPNQQYPQYQILPLDVARLRKRAIIIKELIKYGAKSINDI